VKKPLYSDPRYDAVGSSSLREELFNTYLKGISVSTSNNAKESEPGNPKPMERESREARRERALREREQKVKIEQGKVNIAIEKTRTGMNLEEGERLFKCVVYCLFHATVMSTPTLNVLLFSILSGQC
jgi:hypothetical protein